MKILFEGHIYKNHKVASLLPSDYFDITSQEPKPRVVGYYYSEQYNCPIIVLPKVFLNENGTFFIENIDPELFLESNYLGLITNSSLRNQIANFLFEISSWFYFSIKKYFHKYKNTLSLFDGNLNIVDCSHQENFHTELDLIFSLLKFNKENKNLFLFIKKINLSQNNKTDWNKTVKKSFAHIDSNGSPIYVNTHSKKKQINAEEELLVLFFSLLKHIERKYNIKIQVSPYYKLLSQKEFNKVSRRGTYYLRSIRYKYFDDRLLSLYRLLYLYFEKSEESRIKENRKEYLIIRNYNLVFQDMVDELLSDTNIDKSLKTHKDNKELDHIYKTKSFFEDDNIFFIGDSKYYKRGNAIEQKSIYKQFTYAKNVVQYNIDLFNQNGIYSNNVRYRDDLSEGYNITPNFFIRGIVENLDHFNSELVLDPQQDLSKQVNTHFKDRLFDRDTLVVQSFSINFLFVLWSYISTRSVSNNKFKTEAQKQFRDSLIEFFEAKYNFVRVITEEPINDFIIRNFYYLNGRIYRPENFENDNSFILAVRKDLSAEEYLKQNTTGDFKCINYKLT